LSNVNRPRSHAKGISNIQGKSMKFVVGKIYPTARPLKLMELEPDGEYETREIKAREKKCRRVVDELPEYAKVEIIEQLTKKRYLVKLSQPYGKVLVQTKFVTYDNHINARDVYCLKHHPTWLIGWDAEMQRLGH
jgi:hypothetical protein